MAKFLSIHHAVKKGENVWNNYIGDVCIDNPTVVRFYTPITCQVIEVIVDGLGKITKKITKAKNRRGCVESIGIFVEKPFNLEKVNGNASKITSKVSKKA